MVTGPAVFFVPHQDDEILSMGAYLVQHIEAGREIEVVLVTDGQSSGVRNELISEGYILSYTAFAKARDREFLECLGVLGVPPENIFFENIEDGTLTRGRVKNVMRKYISLFGAGSFKTMSWMDQHKDHFVLGRSLDELNRAGEVPNGDARFCRSLSYQDAPTPGGSWQRASDSRSITEAAIAYNSWNPDAFAFANNPLTGPRYAIGYSSVGHDFDNMLADPKCWVHADSSGYSSSSRADANAWLSANNLPAYL